MKILHTADWHLGKHLEYRSRIEEQEQFVDELVYIVDEHCIDFIIIAGDIYDTFNPSASAERLFFRAMNLLSNGGKRPILIVAGNHDSPQRLSAVSPIATKQGVIIIDKITTKFDAGDYEYFSILESKPGFIKLSINGEKLSIVTIPYVSESRLNELIYNSSSTEKDMQKSYSDKIESLINEACTNYEQDSINIAVGHFYIVGGEQSRSERDIELGGIFSVSSSALPMSAQYVAMGHLHRAQNIKNNIYYSGSPIQYSKKEAHIAKSVYVVDIKTNIEADVVRVLLRNYKPIHLISADSVERAVDKIKALGDHQCYLYIDIKVDDYISMEDIKLMRSLNEDIIEIRPIRSVCHTLGKKHAELGGDIVNDFKDFYKSIRYAEPHEDLLKLFNRLVAEVEEDET